MYSTTHVHMCTYYVANMCGVCCALHVILHALPAVHELCTSSYMLYRTQDDRYVALPDILQSCMG